VGSIESLGQAPARTSASEDGVSSKSSILASVQRALERWASRGEAPSLAAREVDAIYALAWAMFERGRYAEAADLFQLLTLCRPQEARAWLGLGASREASGDRVRAQVAYEAATIAPIGEGDRQAADTRLRGLDAVPPVVLTPRPPSMARGRGRPR
jgi:tetratricopeptide (TPR) repeat protein